MICPSLLKKLSSHFGTPRKKTRNLYIGKLSNFMQFGRGWSGLKDGTSIRGINCVLVLGYSSRNMIVNLFIVVQMKFNPLLDRAARDEEGGGAALPSSRKKKLTKINY